MGRKTNRTTKSVPDADKLSEAENAFLRHSHLIMQEYGIRRGEDQRRRLENNRRKKERMHLRKEDQPLPPYKQAEGFLKRECYSFLESHLRRPDGKKLIRSIVRKYVGEPRYPSFDENPYYWGLLAVDSAHEKLSAQVMSRYAKQLYYADKNHVPPRFLIGFLYQIRGSADLAGMLMQKGRDPSLNMEIPLARPASSS